MNYNKLIETLRQHGVSCVRAHGRYCSICDEATTALSTLQIENEKLRVELEQVKRRKMPLWRVSRTNVKPACITRYFLTDVRLTMIVLTRMEVARTTMTDGNGVARRRNNHGLSVIPACDTKRVFRLSLVWVCWKLHVLRIWFTTSNPASEHSAVKFEDT